MKTPNMPTWTRRGLVAGQAKDPCRCVAQRDGVHLEIHLEESKATVLVPMKVRPMGAKS
jgi:hypothetical protein